MEILILFPLQKGHEEGFLDSDSGAKEVAKPTGCG